MQHAQGWIEALNSLREAGQACVVVVVTDVRGSAPRESGARMIVSGGRLVWGTIGGGRLEHVAIEHASELESSGSRGSESKRYPLAEKVGQCCGGEVTLFFEPFSWARHSVVVFGAGHVAQALGGLADYLGADVLLIDSRSEEEIEPRLEAERDFEVLWIDHPEDEIDRIPARSLVLVMTHDHALDLEIVDRALRRGTFPYLGLIGSERKWDRFRKRLEQRGQASERIETVRCPIGATRTSKEPRAIAVATAAELLEVMHQVQPDVSRSPS